MYLERLSMKITLKNRILIPILGIIFVTCTVLNLTSYILGRNALDTLDPATDETGKLSSHPAGGRLVWRKTIGAGALGQP